MARAILNSLISEDNIDSLEILIKIPFKNNTTRKKEWQN